MRIPEAPKTSHATVSLSPQNRTSCTLKHEVLLLWIIIALLDPEMVPDSESGSRSTDLTGSGFRIHRNTGIDTAVAYSVLTVLGLNLNLIPYGTNIYRSVH
jgi:hypothetical protein